MAKSLNDIFKKSSSKGDDDSGKNWKEGEDSSSDKGDVKSANNTGGKKSKHAILDFIADKKKGKSKAKAGE